MSGLAVGLGLYLLQEVTGAWAAAGLPAVHFTYMAVAMFAFSFAVMALVSVAAGPPARPPGAHVAFERSDLGAEPGAEGRGRLADYRVLAAGLAVLMVGTILAFW